MSGASLEELVDLYHRFGQDRYDEDLSQLDHGLQTAALAVAAKAADTLVVAALLHDVGHLLHLRDGFAGPVRHSEPPEADRLHEAIGSRYLAELFPAEVTAPVALHVRAKRYRCAVDRQYRAQLSAGSKRSLQRQGGPLTHAEAVTFEANPTFQEAVALREWDDRGKVDGLAVAPFESYRLLLERSVLRR